MNKTNMLSANKVKLHGMTSTKWTTKDKITQYKGLINLYTRDKKIIEMDTQIAQRKQCKELKVLQTAIEQGRKDLDNAVRGDKQKLRNTLADHREIQLAFQNAQPEKVIDMVNQVNFTKRKTRDILNYRMQQKSNELIDLKLKYASFEDRLNFESLSWQGMFPCEKQAHIITGKVQDAILKKQAAIYICNSYKEMIAIMKKDALYFDAILVSIQSDGLSQGKCMINATKLGQLGTEYLDDRRQEFQLLEKVVKKDMISRKKDLQLVKQNVENFAQNLRYLLRRDSDINLGKIELAETASLSELKNEMDTVEQTLTYLRKSIFTPTIESIFPCIKEQLRQKERLHEFVTKCEKNRDELLNKTKHASLMRAQLENTMIDTTSQYNAEKIQLKKEIEETVNKKQETRNLIDNRHNLLAKIRIGLKHLYSLTTLLNRSEKRSGYAMGKLSRTIPQSILVGDDEPIDASKLLPELITKFSKLAASAKDILSGTTLEEGYRTFEYMMQERRRKNAVDVVLSEESLVDTVYMDAHVLTRDDIKKQSAEIVAQNAVSEDFMAIRPVRKKKYKFK